MKKQPQIYSVVAAFLSWGVFMLVSLLLNVVCAVMLILPHRRRLAPLARAAIQRLFGAWMAWLHALGLVYVTWEGFTPEALEGGAVYISNHPGLLDATFLLSRLPNTICIFKPSLIRNPAVGPAAVAAGYAAGDTGIDLIRDVATRVSSGPSLLIFPEGHRTARDVDVNRLRPGFALIARRAGVPVRMISIEAPRGLLPRDQVFWRVPALPAVVRIRFIGELPDDGKMTVTEFTAHAQARLEAALRGSRLAI